MPVGGLPGREVVSSPFLVISKDLIGLVDVLQALFTTRFVLVSIRVILHGQSAIRLLDLFIRRFPLHSQEPVIILGSQCFYLL
jgi:hypothetical protein